MDLRAVGFIHLKCEVAEKPNVALAISDPIER